MTKNSLIILFAFISTITFGQETSTYFDGTDNVIDCSTGAVTLPATFTQEMWIYIDGTQDSWKGLIGDGTVGNLNRPPSLYTYNTTGVHFGFGDGTEWLSTTLSGDLLVQDQWNHYAVTFDGQDYKLYINGAEIIFDGSFAAGKTPYATPVRYIGWSNGSNHFTGKIDEVRLWNIVRTLDEIRGFMCREIPNPNTQTGLVTYYKMNDGSGTTATNEITGAADGTLVNMSESDWQDSEAFNTWLGVTGDWNTASNWSRGAIPVVNDNLGIYSNATETPILTSLEVAANLVINGINSSIMIDESSYLETVNYYSLTSNDLVIDGDLEVFDTLEVSGNIDGEGMVYAGHYKLREEPVKKGNRGIDASVTIFNLRPGSGQRAAGGTWLGDGTTNDWFDADNWNKGVPKSNTSILIDKDYDPPHWPQVNTSGSVAKGKSLYLDGTNAILTVGSDGDCDISITGGGKKNKITIVDGEIEVDGGIFYSNVEVIIDNSTLTIDNSATVEVDKDVDVEDGGSIVVDNSSVFTIGQ